MELHWFCSRRCQPEVFCAQRFKQFFLGARNHRIACNMVQLASGIASVARWCPGANCQEQAQTWRGENAQVSYDTVCSIGRAVAQAGRVSCRRLSDEAHKSVTVEVSQCLVMNWVMKRFKYNNNTTAREDISTLTRLGITCYLSRGLTDAQSHYDPTTFNWVDGYDITCRDSGTRNVTAAIERSGVDSVHTW
jgi:hypothetical protein